MLSQLEINNIALINKVSFEPGKGLNVLTGETGAGKSIIIDSINAILGERLSKDLIRTGKDKAMVEAAFQLDNDKFADIFEKVGIESDEEGSLVISREFSTSGKNICRVNGKLVNASVLKEIGERIIDIHGQHDNQSLLRTESHMELLDSFSGEKIQRILREYQKLLDDYKKIKNKLKSYSGDKNGREKKVDLLEYQIDEIKKAKVRVGEEEDLNRQRLLMANSEKIISALSKSYELLFSGNNSKESATDSIKEALPEIGGISRIDKKFNDIERRLEELVYQLDDIINDIRRERDETEYNPGMLEQIDERLDLLYKLKRKYGNTIEEILDFCKKSEYELEELAKSEEIVKDLHKQLERINEELYIKAKEINQERLSAAKILEDKIGCELDDLEMKNAKFKVDIGFNDATDMNGELKYNQSGLNAVEFLISPNVGEPLKPLSKIASGGEMSRIMLAIKTILANVDKIQTLIFDEIDIGISGKAAQKVGEKLSYISKNHQVICVTHLTQIACLADEHFLIKKMSDESHTETTVQKLEGTEARDEIARLLGGANISEITIKHAEEILKNASLRKSVSL